MRCCISCADFIILAISPRPPRPFSILSCSLEKLFVSHRQSPCHPAWGLVFVEGVPFFIDFCQRFNLGLLGLVLERADIGDLSLWEILQDGRHDRMQGRSVAQGIIGRIADLDDGRGLAAIDQRDSPAVAGPRLQSRPEFLREIGRRRRRRGEFDPPYLL